MKIWSCLFFKFFGLKLALWQKVHELWYWPYIQESKQMITEALPKAKLSDWFNNRTPQADMLSSISVSGLLWLQCRKLHLETFLVIFCFIYEHVLKNWNYSFLKIYLLVHCSVHIKLIVDSRSCSPNPSPHSPKNKMQGGNFSFLFFEKSKCSPHLLLLSSAQNSEQTNLLRLGKYLTNYKGIIHVFGAKMDRDENSFDDIAALMHPLVQEGTTLYR